MEYQGFRKASGWTVVPHYPKNSDILPDYFPERSRSKSSIVEAAAPDCIEPIARGRTEIP